MQENKSGTVLILGDSTSMSIGLEKQTHTFINAGRNIWPPDTVIINSSLPGMTAADSAAFYFRHKNKECKNLLAVLIYLGNCDTTSTEVRKGKYDKFNQTKDQLREFFNKMPAKTSIKNRLLHFEWNNTFNPKLELPEHPEDFEFNIGRVIQDCRKNSVPVILVRPKANQFFPSGIGKGNFSFYKYLGINDKIAAQIIIPDSRFKDALNLQENGMFDEAANLYKEILIKPPIAPMSQEYSLMVSNNYAVAKAELGNFSEATYLLQLLLKESSIRQEIILFNLSQIKRIEGLLPEAEALMTESFESDTSLYRVRQPYIDAIDRLSQKFNATKVVDMYSLIQDHLYLDHCHPLPAGQGILADAIAGKFKEVGVAGGDKATVRNILYNPEFANGNKDFFHTYFKTFAPFSEAEISSQIDVFSTETSNEIAIRESVPEVSASTRELKTAFEYYFRHPVFTCFNDILHFPPKYPSDIGRFPEFYLVRHLIPYLRMYESISDFDGNIDFECKLLRSSNDLISVLPEESTRFIETSLSEANKPYEEQRLERIIAKTRKLLSQHLQAGSQIYNRTKATIFWYVRETLRFGSHSRYSMRYDRLLLEYLAEGLAVAKILNHNLGNKRTEEVNKLITILNQTAKTHEEYCAKFILKANNDSLLKEYNSSLKDIHNKIA